VINCAGKTGRPNIDWCEDHKPETLRSNTTGALVLLGECLQRCIYLVHLSSGCLYRGDSGGTGFGEEDPPNFLDSFYVRTKWWAEEALSEFPVLIVRPRMIFD
jgi:dTDP-4-dehydrorhamnose reductase